MQFPYLSIGLLYMYVEVNCWENFTFIVFAIIFLKFKNSQFSVLNF
jgi:hypothetical protein